VQFAGIAAVAASCIGPLSGKERPPQDDKRLGARVSGTVPAQRSGS